MNLGVGSSNLPERAIPPSEPPRKTSCFPAFQLEPDTCAYVLQDRSTTICTTISRDKAAGNPARKNKTYPGGWGKGRQPPHRFGVGELSIWLRGYVFIGLCQNVLLIEEGYPAGYVSWGPCYCFPATLLGHPLLETYQYAVGIAL